MVLCDDEQLHERMLFLRDHGRLPGDVSFRSVEVGVEVQDERAAGRARSGAARPHRGADRQEARRSSAGTQERLAGAGVALNVERPGERATYWMVTAVFDEATGVTAEPSATRWPPTASRPGRSSRRSARCRRSPSRPTSAAPARENPVSYDLARAAINLPSALMLEERDVDGCAAPCERLAIASPEHARKELRMQIDMATRCARGHRSTRRFRRSALRRARRAMPRRRYSSADPFPHGVYDDFLPPRLAHALSASFPTFDSIEWVRRDNENNRRVYQHDETQAAAALTGACCGSSTAGSSCCSSRRSRASTTCSPIRTSSAVASTSAGRVTS